MDGRRGLEGGRFTTSLLKTATSSEGPIDSFDVAQTAIEISRSEDSDMAQYARTKRKKTSDGKGEKALQTAGFALFSQCLNHGVVNSGNALTDLVRMTKSMLSPPWIGEGGQQHGHLSHADDEMEVAIEENVEIGEEEILRHDYDLERV